MKIETFDSEQAWLDARLGRITGTRAGGLLSKRDKKPLKSFYEIIAERIAIPPDNENVMDRGKRLEDYAIEEFMQQTRKKVKTDLVIWSREDDPNIAVSPDGYIGKTEAVECKCLNSAAHLEAYITQKIPSDYEAQVIQYFVVNDDLKKLYFVFYDPRMPGASACFYLTFTREELQAAIDLYLEEERAVLARIAEIEKQLTF